MPFTYDFPRPMVTVDAAVFVPRGKSLEIALIRRGQEPFTGKWALPGGFIEMDEELIDGAARELEEETGIRAPWLREACAAGTVGRDPRGRTVSAVFYTLLPKRPAAQAGDDAAEVEWFNAEQLPPMAFDHGEVAARTLARLCGDALISPVAFHALPPRFTVEQFIAVSQAIPSLRGVWRDPGKKLDLLAESGKLQMTGDGSMQVDWDAWREPSVWI